MDVRLIVVTICFNNLYELKRTCASVDVQSRPPDEHWIINGSTTQEIKEWSVSSEQPKYRRFVNEPDAGISDAFNKGIRHSGDGWIQLLNSGDELASERVLERIHAFLVARPSLDWISGKILVERMGRWNEFGCSFERAKLNRGMRRVSHPSWWVRKAVYDRIGGYDLRYKIAMDYDMLCRIRHGSYAFYPFASVRFDFNGISSRQFGNSMREVKQIYQGFFGKSYFMTLWQFKLKTTHVIIERTKVFSLGRRGPDNSILLFLYMYNDSIATAIPKQIVEL